MKIILLILAIAFSSVSFAQGNLQFNQVINDEIIDLIGTSTQVIGSVTVPAGKVWKIEAVSLITAPSGNSQAPFGNGYLVFFDNLCIINGTTMRQVPIWLSAGVYSVRARSSGTQNYSFSYSAIEFNVVP